MMVKHGPHCPPGVSCSLEVQTWFESFNSTFPFLYFSLLRRVSSSQGISMALKRKRASSPSSSVSGGDFEDSQTSMASAPGRKRRRTSNIPTVDPVTLIELGGSGWSHRRRCLERFPLVCRLLSAMNCTTQSETIKTTRAGCCVSSSSELRRGGEECSSFTFHHLDMLDNLHFCVSGINRITTTLCLSPSTWWRSSRSWRWRSMMTSIS